MRLRVGPLADHRLHRIARGDVEQQEGHDEHAEQGGHQQREPGAGESGSRDALHRRPPLAGEDRGIRQPFTSGCTAQTSAGNQRKIHGARSKTRASISRESRAFSAVSGVLRARTIIASSVLSARNA